MLLDMVFKAQEMLTHSLKSPNSVLCVTYKRFYQSSDACMPNLGYTFVIYLVERRVNNASTSAAIPQKLGPANTSGTTTSAAFTAPQRLGPGNTGKSYL